MTSDAETSQRHLAAHIFGAALSEELGPKALNYCTSDFAYGCFHEVFKRYIAEYGTASVRDAVDSCEKASGLWHACHHALGHGLVVHFGYTIDGLENALAVCSSSFNEDPVNGCIGGAFMEYNLYTMMGAEIEARPIGPDGRYAPCPSLSETYAEACYFWLPQWWRTLLRQSGDDEQTTFKKMGDLCRAVPDKRHARDCFERIGQHTAYAWNGSLDEIRHLCALATDDPSLMLSCKTYAAFILRYTNNDEAAGYKLCADYSGEARKYCEAHVKGTASKTFPIPIPAL